MIKYVLQWLVFFSPLNIVHKKTMRDMKKKLEDWSRRDKNKRSWKNREGKKKQHSEGRK